MKSATAKSAATKTAAPKGGPAKTAPPRGPRVDNRREALLDAAATVFNSHGFASATIRDIATAAGMLPGSVYYHFDSKEELFIAVHEEGIRRTTDTVLQALEGIEGPWRRLEAAVGAHLRAILDRSDYAAVVIAPTRQIDPDLQARLVALRDSYEVIFRDLIEALPLVAGTDRKYLRLALMGAINWTQTWFKREGEPPETLGRKLLKVFQQHRPEGSR
mgnify:CR=1 FL=1